MKRVNQNPNALMIVPTLSGVILADVGLRPEEGEREVVGCVVRVLMPASAVDECVIGGATGGCDSSAGNDNGEVELVWPAPKVGLDFTPNRTMIATSPCKGKGPVHRAICRTYRAQTSILVSRDKC